MAYGSDPFSKGPAMIGFMNPFGNEVAAKRESEDGTFRSGVQTFGYLKGEEMKAEAAAKAARERAKSASSGGFGGIGGIAGSLAGSFLGPIGTAAGGAIGKLFG